MAFGEAENDLVCRKLHGFQRELSDVAQFVFHINFEVVGLKNRIGFIENLREFAGGKPMIDIVGKPGLQAAQRIVAQRASAIDETFIDARHFRDVRMPENELAIGQKKADVGIRMFL